MGEVYSNATDWIFGLSPLVMIVALLVLIWKSGVPYQKWLIIIAGLLLILLGNAIYTDNTMFDMRFFGSDRLWLVARNQECSCKPWGFPPSTDSARGTWDGPNQEDDAPFLLPRPPVGDV